MSDIVERCHRPSGDPTSVVVFDLNGTLMDNRSRTSRILRDLAENWSAQRPEHAERLRHIGPEGLACGLRTS